MEIIVPTLQDRMLTSSEIITVPFKDRVFRVIWSTNGDSIVGESDPVLAKSGVRVFVNRGRVLVSSYTLVPGSIDRIINEPVELLVTSTEQIESTSPDLAELVTFLLETAERHRDAAPVREQTQTDLNGLI